jgi:hypothetical protein
MPMTHEHTRQLRRYEPLSRLGGYQVGPHQSDPRGWNVLSPDGRTVGEVKDLIVDTGAMRARYLAVELDTALLTVHADPHVLVPIERAHRDGGHRRLVVDGLTTERVTELIEARDRHIDTFWERWWSGDPGRPGPRNLGESTTSTHEHLRRALEEVRPGEQVRIPVVDEEIVVERRPVTRHQ